MSVSRTTQKPLNLLHCHPCTKVMADIIRPHVDTGIPIPDDLAVPMAQYAYSEAIFLVNGMAVSLPVCLNHFIEATKTSSLLV